MCTAARLTNLAMEITVTFRLACWALLARLAALRTLGKTIEEIIVTGIVGYASCSSFRIRCASVGAAENTSTENKLCNIVTSASSYCAAAVQLKPTGTVSRSSKTKIGSRAEALSTAAKFSQEHPCYRGAGNLQ